MPTDVTAGPAGTDPPIRGWLSLEAATGVTDATTGISGAGQAAASVQIAEIAILPPLPSPAA